MDFDVVNVDSSVNVAAAPAGPSIVKSLTKTRMETFETRFAVIVVVIFIFVVIIDVVAVSAVIGVPSIPSTRRQMMMTTMAMKMV